MMSPYEVLSRKKAGEELGEDALAAIVDGASGDGWTDAQLAAFLMAVAIRGLSPRETRVLTERMMTSGDVWDLKADVPSLGDKHSTGGVGDKVSLVIGPLLAACGQPVVMMTGRGLGHTGGTADKLDCIPGLDQQLDRGRCLELINDVNLAICVPTPRIAPADRRLYELRSSTATVDSLPLITASILSKKLATGAGAVVFDVKVGSGAFLPDAETARQLARMLVETSRALGTLASAALTDMSQPLGEWIGNTVEVGEAVACLEGRGPADLMEVTYALGMEVVRLTGASCTRQELERAIETGAAREQFDRWVVAQGGDPIWLPSAIGRRAPVEVPVVAERTGVLTEVDTARLGLALVRGGAGRSRVDDEIDQEVALRYRARLGEALSAGDEIARIYLRQENLALLQEISSCFRVADEGTEPELIVERISG